MKPKQKIYQFVHGDVAYFVKAKNEKNAMEKMLNGNHDYSLITTSIEGE